MSIELRVGTRKRVSWAVLLGASVLLVGPCSNLQYPPFNTESIWGVAIARGQEVPPERQIDANVVFMPDGTSYSTDGQEPAAEAAAVEQPPLGAFASEEGEPHVAIGVFGDQTDGGIEAEMLTGCLTAD